MQYCFWQMLYLMKSGLLNKFFYVRKPFIFWDLLIRKKKRKELQSRARQMCENGWKEHAPFCSNCCYLD